VRSRVVITGIGVISVLGDSISEIFNCIDEDKSAFKKIINENILLSCQYTGCYDNFDATPYLGKKGLRYLNRCTRMTLAAAGLALKDGGFSITTQNEEKVGVILATNLGVDDHIREMERIVFTEGADSLSPVVSPFCSINAIAGQVSIRMKPKAFNITVPAGFSSGINSVLLAKNLIASGKAKAVIVGGAEALPMDVIKEYDLQNILAKSSEEMIPFSLDSKGILLGDGAAFILVEDLEHALTRKAKIYAEVSDGFLAFHNEESNEGREKSVKKNMDDFLKKNMIQPENVDLIMSSANGSYLDQVEQNVFIKTFSENTQLFNIKTWFGEGFSFTNQLQMSIGASTMRLNKIPGKFPLRQLKHEIIEVKDECNDLQKSMNNVLINSCGLDGTYGIVLLKNIIR
jgi:3-oxoacyl-[acyl-carrier-protein] synthase II